MIYDLENSLISMMLRKIDMILPGMDESQEMQVCLQGFVQPFLAGGSRIFSSQGDTSGLSR